MRTRVFAIAALLGLAAITALVCERRGARASEPAADSDPRILRVAVASSVAGALKEMGTAFERGHAGVTVAVTAGASGTLVAQIMNGAPFDIFFSADLGYPTALIESGHAKRSPCVYAVGRLFMWTDKKIAGQTWRAALADPGVRTIAIANPRGAPYGRAARAALEAAGLWNRFDGRIVMGENVEQTAQFLRSGAAEAGFVPESLLGSLDGDGRSWVIGASDSCVIEHGAAVIAASDRTDLAAEFLAWVLGADGKAVLKAHGLTPAGE